MDSIDADATVAVLDKIVSARGTTPEFLRCDNGPELTANALRDWCRFSHTARATSIPDHPGRTRGSSPTGLACATSPLLFGPACAPAS